MKLRKESVTLERPPSTQDDFRTSSEAPLSFAEKLGRFDASAASKALAQKSKQEENKVIRPSVSAAASNPGAVRAMAAMFETDQGSELESSELANETQRSSLVLQPSQDQLNKTVRASKSAPSSSRAEMDSTPVATKSHQNGRKYSVSGPPEEPDHAEQKSSIPQSVASKALALMQAAKRAEGTSVARPSPMLRHPSFPRRNEGHVTPTPPDVRNPGTLGKMIPPQEQPPVAQHLNLARPPSTVPGTPSIEINSLEDSENVPPGPRPGSTTLLHSQIRSLQRQLEAKTEESSQLRRQLEAQEGSDIGTLSEQLREAKREVGIWKDRAEAAERRVKVFEKFTAKLRGIREAAAVAEQQEGDIFQCRSGEGSSSSCERGSNDENISPAQHVRFAQGQRVGRTTETCSSGGSGRTEDAGVVTARIRKCLHDEPTANDGAADSPDGSRVYLPKALDIGSRHCSGSSRRDISASAMEIWVAAQELLHIEDEGHAADDEISWNAEV